MKLEDLIGKTIKNITINDKFTLNIKFEDNTGFHVNSKDYLNLAISRKEIVQVEKMVLYELGES